MTHDVDKKGERVVFSEETGADQYLKLVAAGEMNGDLLGALEDYIKRQKKRLGLDTLEDSPAPPTLDLTQITREQP
jgi:hypothetical protein